MELHFREPGLYKPKPQKHLSEKEFIERLAKIKEIINAQIKPFTDISEEAKQKRREACLKDPELFKATYLSHYFTKPTAHYQKEIHEICNLGNKSLNVIEVYREGGKSATATFFEPIFKACGLTARYQIIISDSVELAAENLSWIKLEFEENPRLKCDFGNEGNFETPGSWEAHDYVVQTYQGPVRFRALGSGMKIRGTKFMMFRPDYIVIDDLENDENVKNKKLVQLKFEWILGAVYPSLADYGTLVMVGTPLDKISVLTKLVEHIQERKDKIEARFGIKGMNAIKYPALKEDGSEQWPEGKDIETLLRIKETVTFDVWMREFMLQPVDSGQFKLAWMKDFDRDVIIMNRTNYSFYAGVDISAKEKEINDYKAIVIIALNAELKKRYAVDAFIRHTTFESLYDKFIEFFEFYRMAVTGFEDNGLQEIVKDALQAKCRAKGLFPNIRGLTHNSDKVARIIRWQGMVEKQDLLFCKGYGDIETLMLQLNGLGTRMHDDGPDGLDMAIEVSNNLRSKFEFESAGKRSYGSMERITSFVRGEFL